MPADLCQINNAALPNSPQNSSELPANAPMTAPKAPSRYLSLGSKNSRHASNIRRYSAVINRKKKLVEENSGINKNRNDKPKSTQTAPDAPQVLSPRGNDNGGNATVSVSPNLGAKKQDDNGDYDKTQNNDKPTKSMSPPGKPNLFPPDSSASPQPEKKVSKTPSDLLQRKRELLQKRKLAQRVVSKVRERQNQEQNHVSDGAAIVGNTNNSAVGIDFSGGNTKKGLTLLETEGGAGNNVKSLSGTGSPRGGGKVIEVRQSEAHLAQLLEEKRDLARKRATEVEKRGERRLRRKQKEERMKETKEGKGADNGVANAKKGSKRGGSASKGYGSTQFAKEFTNEATDSTNSAADGATDSTNSTNSTTASTFPLFKRLMNTMKESARQREENDREFVHLLQESMRRRSIGTLSSGRVDEIGRNSIANRGSFTKCGIVTKRGSVTKCGSILNRDSITNGSSPNNNRNSSSAVRATVTSRNSTKVKQAVGQPMGISKPGSICGSNPSGVSEANGTDGLNRIGNEILYRELSDRFDFYVEDLLAFTADSQRKTVHIAVHELDEQQ
jgi:hypothetical protein